MLRSLAQSDGSTYLIHSWEATNPMIRDMNQNTVVPITTAQNVRVYTIDETTPSLESYDIDMTAEVLTLTFSETVDTATLDVTGITIQESESQTLNNRQLSSAAQTSLPSVLITTAPAVIVKLITAGC